MTIAYDCRACAACCIGGFDDGHGFADLLPGEDVRWPAKHRYRLVVLRVQDQVYRSTPGDMTEDYGKICGFLRGTPGCNVSCTVYGHRPQVCVKFRPGSRPCRDSRAALGLP